MSSDAVDPLDHVEAELSTQLDSLMKQYRAATTRKERRRLRTEIRRLRRHRFNGRVTPR